MSWGPLRAKVIYESHCVQTQQLHLHMINQQQNARIGPGGLHVSQSSTLPKMPDILEKYQIMDVELCNTCLPIWAERVSKLCTQDGEG